MVFVYVQSSPFLIDIQEEMLIKCKTCGKKVFKNKSLFRKGFPRYESIKQNYLLFIILENHKCKIIE